MLTPTLPRQTWASPAHESAVLPTPCARGFFTSNFLTDETYTLLLVRLGYRFAIRYLEELRASSITVVRITSVDEERAEEILRQYADKSFSYTDATSFAIIERLRLDAAFTFDRNFTEFGRIRVLTPDDGSRP
jgi:predicted nucleic acid-binding protein